MGLQHYRNLQFFWPGDRIIVATTMGDAPRLKQALDELVDEGYVKITMEDRGNGPEKHYEISGSD